MNVELVSKTEIAESFILKECQKLRENNLIPEMESEAYFSNIGAEELIVYIARVSSSRDNKWEDFDKLINYLIDHKHWSPFEHAYMTVEIETSRAITHQLIRHRSFTFQEFSQRYAEVTEFEDIELREQPENNRQSSGKVLGSVIRENNDWRVNRPKEFKSGQASVYAMDSLSHIQQAYEDLLEGGVARETARFILPLCTKSTLYMTGNIRSWIHFLDIRDDSHAQKEIVEIAQEIGKIFQQEYPVISQALGFNYE